MSGDVEARIGRLEADVSQLKQMFNGITEKLNDLKHDLRTVASDKDSLEKKLSDFQSEFSGMRQDFKELMNDVTDAQSELQKLQQSMQHNLELLRVRFSGDIDKLEITMHEFRRLKSNATKAMWTISSLVLVDLIVRFFIA